MKIYDQQGGTCRTHAIAYAMQNEFGIYPTEEEIVAYDKKATKYAKEAFRAKYLTVPILLKYFKKNPLCGVVLDSYEWLYNEKVGKYKNLKMYKLTTPYMKNLEHLIFGFKIRKGGWKNRIDKWGVYRPDVREKVIDHHAVYCSAKLPVISPHYPANYFKGVNSAGEDFGLNGYFLFKKSDLYTELSQALKIKLKNECIKTKISQK